MVRSWFIDNDTETDHKFALFKQNNEFLKFWVYDVEKKTKKMISDLLEKIVLSAVGFKIGVDNFNEKEFPFRKLVDF